MAEATDAAEKHREFSSSRCPALGNPSRPTPRDVDPGSDGGLRNLMKTATEGHLERKELYFQERKRLLDREMALKASFIEFDTFVQDGIGKQDRDRMKVQHERRLQEEKEDEIERTTSDLDSLNERLLFLQDRLARFGPVSEFLVEVEKSEAKIKGAQDVLSTHTTLTRTLEGVTASRHDLRRALADTQADFLRAFQERYSKIYLMEMRQRRYRHELDAVGREVSELRRHLEQIQHTHAGQHFEIYHVDVIVDNLLHVVQKFHVSPLKTDTTLLRLEKIKEFIDDLEYVIEEMRKSEISTSNMAEGSDLSLARMNREQRQ